MDNMIVNMLRDTCRILADDYGWAISNVEIDTTYGICERPIMTVSPIADDTIGGRAIEKNYKLDGGINCQIWQPPKKRIIALLPIDAPALDEIVEDAAYALGAWDMTRDEFPPNYSAVDIYFGQESRQVVKLDFEKELPDRYGDTANEDVVERARQEGFLSYRFRAASIASAWQRKLWVGKDTTLQPDGTRELVPLRRISFYGPMPEIPGSGGHQHIFEYGKKPKKKG